MFTLTQYYAFASMLRRKQGSENHADW
jgi:hypothetical protein